jgi:hypothetical protein
VRQLSSDAPLLNWIHPFDDGNGWTSRSSYVVLMSAHAAECMSFFKCMSFFICERPSGAALRPSSWADCQACSGAKSRMSPPPDDAVLTAQVFDALYREAGLPLRGTRKAS